MQPQSSPGLFPLFLKLAGREVLVVGAGSVAARKIAALADAGASVRVVAPDATPEVELLASEKRVSWERRAFDEPDLDDTWLVFAATSDETTQSRVAAAAEARRVFCVAVDDPEHASAYSGGVVVRPPFVVAISSSGAAPALTRLVREIVEHVLPSEGWIEHAKALRARWLAEGTPMADRFAELVRDVKAGAP